MDARIKSILNNMLKAFAVPTTQLHGSTMIRMGGTGKGPKRLTVKHVTNIRTDVCIAKQRIFKTR